MSWWVRIQSAPVRQFHVAGEKPDGMDLDQYSAGLLDPAATVQADTGGEGMHVTVTLQNRTGEIGKLYEQPPLAAPVQIWRDGQLVLTGQVTGVSLGDTASIEVQS